MKETNGVQNYNSVLWYELSIVSEVLSVDMWCPKPKRIMTALDLLKMRQSVIFQERDRFALP